MVPTPDADDNVRAIPPPETGTGSIGHAFTRHEIATDAYAEGGEARDSACQFLRFRHLTRTFSPEDTE